MITTSNSPVKGSGTPNQLLGVLLHTIAISLRRPVTIELLRFLAVLQPPLLYLCCIRICMRNLLETRW